MSRSSLFTLDWFSVFLFIALVFMGWISIYSASHEEFEHLQKAMSKPHIKQGIWIGLSFVLIIVILLVQVRVYVRFASIIYGISVLSLIGLFLFGKTISGATSWYVFGPVSIQPSEFAKAATSLAVARFLSTLQINIKQNLSDLLKIIGIIALPALIIIPQPDPGSGLVYAAFIFPLFREGLNPIYPIIGLSSVTIFILTLLLGPKLTCMLIGLLFLIVIIRKLFKEKSKFKQFPQAIGIYILVVLSSLSVDYIFHNIFQQRHRDRFNILLGLKNDNIGIGYNTNQSKIAIGSGEWFGKGWLKGTQTKGGFVPEQHTDYIFSNVGEEWGFIGATTVIILFTMLLFRIQVLAERQKNQFTRVYGYSVMGIFFIHFTINIGMVLGILPTVGIPLPFFSYGGSGLWGFTILLFILLKLDANRLNEW